jgi:hypothetical protein
MEQNNHGLSMSPHVSEESDNNSPKEEKNNFWIFIIFFQTIILGTSVALYTRDYEYIFLNEYHAAIYAVLAFSMQAVFYWLYKKVEDYTKELERLNMLVSAMKELEDRLKAMDSK